MHVITFGECRWGSPLGSRRTCVWVTRLPNGRTAGMFLSAAECLLLRLPSIRARSLGLRSIGEGTRRLTGDDPSTEAAEEATGGHYRPMTNIFLHKLL